MKSKIFIIAEAGVNHNGNILIGDMARIRKIDNSGIITTIAGNGIQGFSGDGGPASSAQFYTSYGIFIDAYNNIFMAI